MNALNLPQSTISRHLSILRRGGVVKVKRDNTHCYYSFNGEGLMGRLKQRLIQAYCETLRDAEPFKTDRVRLNKLKSECYADCDVCITE